MKSHRTMTSLVDEYVAFRRRLGFTFGSVGCELGLFAKYADRTRHKGPINTDLVVRWATSNSKSSPDYRAWRFHAIRSFLLHRVAEDPRNEVPPRGLLGRGFRRAQPHIFSARKTCALLQATSALGPARGLRPRTYTTLFGLLAATGLRISEALGLTCPMSTWTAARSGSRRVREAERASFRCTAPRGQHCSAMLASGGAGIRSRGQMRSS